MGILKDVLIGAAALKALKQSNKPGVIPPAGITVLGLKHEGLGSSWKVTYIKDSNPNVKLNFKIKKGISGRYSGGGQWKFHWN